jgi:replicative DNA helicase
MYEPDCIHEMGLRSDHFFDPTHGRLWDAICMLSNSGRGTDPVVVGHTLEADEGLKSLGGLGFLANLVVKAPAGSDAPRYAAIVVDAAKRRRIVGVCREIRAQVGQGVATESVIQGLETTLLEINRDSRKLSVVSAFDAAEELVSSLEKTDADDLGVLCGIGPLDDHLGRLQPDELILIAGRPGMGKSALAACIALNMARNGLGVIEINSEMSVAQMMRRHVSDLAFRRYGSEAPTYKDIKRRQVSAKQRGMAQWGAGEASKLPLVMIKKTGLNLSALRSIVRRQAYAWERMGVRLGAITVDHVGLLTVDGGRDRYSDQTEIAIGMKALADELHIPVIALVQLNRRVEERDNKRPQLSDLRDSGAWEENADTVIGCFREAYYANKEPEPKGDDKWAEWSRRRGSKKVEALILKAREGEEAAIELWASIGHNAIRGEAPHAEL